MQSHAVISQNRIDLLYNIPLDTYIAILITSSSVRKHQKIEKMWIFNKFLYVYYLIFEETPLPKVAACYALQLSYRPTSMFYQAYSLKYTTECFLFEDWIFFSKISVLFVTFSFNNVILFIIPALIYHCLLGRLLPYIKCSYRFP